MGKSVLSGGFVQGSDKRPAASTNVFTSKVVFDAAASFQAGFTTVGAITVSGGLVFLGGGARKFAAGTYIGIGGATAPIIAAGATIRQVFLQRRIGAYPSAGTLDARGGIPRPCKAAGTPGSFYPRVFRTGATNKEVYAGNGVSATFQWFAVCG